MLIGAVHVKSKLLLPASHVGSLLEPFFFYLYC